MSTITKRKILVVDDEVELCDIFSDMLRLRGYEVFSAYGGNEAFDKIKNDPTFEVVISDITMPNGSGPELSHKLREAGIQVRFYYITGYSESDRDELLSAGAIEIFNKPLNYDAIIAEIEKPLKVA